MAEIPITVLMPVYNAQLYLREAMDSILGQTYGDFEFLIINDGSTDSSPVILNSYRDSRIRVIRQENQGVAAALHLGVELARGEYIARMDADDESLPHRLEIQKKTLEENPQGVLAYGLHDLIDEQGNLLRACQGEGFNNDITKWILIWMNFFTHPTVMMRKKTLRGHNLNYRSEINGAEDFDLWNRLSGAGSFLFIPQVLLRYRLNSKSVNRVNRGERQFRGYFVVIQENFKRFGLSISSELAKELVVISGQSPQNPLTYPYQYLPEKLHPLAEDISKRFAESMSNPPDELFPVQAEQRVRWARCLLQSSKKASLSLLLRAFQSHPPIVLTRVFIWTLSVLFLPRKALAFMNKRRTRPLI